MCSTFPLAAAKAAFTMTNDNGLCIREPSVAFVEACGVGHRVCGLAPRLRRPRGLQRSIPVLGTHSWRIFKPKKPLPLFIDVKHTFGTAYLNGAYYWLLNGGSRTDYSILSFDFGCEIFEEIEGHDCHFVHSSVLGMMLLDDSIAILNSNIDERFAYDIWVMIQPGIWNKRVTFQCFPKIKSCYDSSLILATKASRLVSYNVLTNKTRHHEFECSCLTKHPLYGGCGVFYYKESLVSIKQQEDGELDH
uniref:Class S F-box protein n=1 Tax=Solanum tuberosum TaxID=4113 RepID=M1E0W2_SOLTU